MTIRRGSSIIAGVGPVDQTYSSNSTNAQSGIAVASAISGLTNTDLSNLTSQGQNIANWSNNVTNCITEIPQDIKLELNNGTLTLKAGSKVYVPNGFESDGTTPKFDVVVTTQDATGLEWFSTSSKKNQMVFFRKDGLGIDSTVSTSSGTSYPSSHSNGDRCYRTDLNLLYTFRTSNNQWNLEDCLPIAIVQPSSTEAGKVSSIDQIFNGFGYIGSTVFALPGVKGLIPNGRNADGSLKNIEFFNDRVKTFTLLNPEISILNLYDGTIGIDIATYTLSNFFIQNNAPTNYQYMLWLDTLNNEFKYTENTGNSWVKVNLFNAATLTTVETGKIISFTPKTAFHAMDYNDYAREVDNKISEIADKVGIVKGYAGTTPPEGWLFCDGSAISRTTYSDLFAVIGTAYGAGNGSTTFNLPNLWILGQISPVTVYGNGKAITYTDSQYEFALASSNNDPGRVQPSTQLTYGNIGAQPNGGWVKSNRAVGLATNANHGMTGIVGTAHLDNASQTARAIIKY